MTLALAQAELAQVAGEVPVGAVLIENGRLVAAAHNRVERDGDATAHAEVLAIREAGARSGGWRLNEAILCVTLEPCPMCASACKLARIGTVVYGASDPKMGGCGSIFDLSQDSRYGSVPRVISGVKEAECSELLKRFFVGRRGQ